MFTYINLPYTKYIPENNADSYYIAAIHSARHWIKEFELDDVCKNRDIRCVVGWVKPKHRMPIHLDMGPDGPTPWALDFTTEEFKTMILELYESTESDIPSKMLVAPPYNDYGIPVIGSKNAKLINAWSFSRGAVKFNPGKYWHTGYNPSDQWMAVVSLRSFNIEDWFSIEEKFKSMGML